MRHAPGAPLACLAAGCRAGFEVEAGADLARAAQALGLDVELETPRGEGIALGRLASVPRSLAPLADERPVFARNAFVGLGPLDLLGAPPSARPDRITPLLAAVAALPEHLHGRTWRGLYVEHPDTNEGKALSPLARALEARIAAQLREQDRLDERAPRRLHVLLRDGGRAFVGTSDASATPWPLGIPRIRVPKGAPSRSAAKLAEAFVVFLGEQAPEVLRPGMRAVDLGAAPGGWTWLLAERGLRVTAVDNGPLKGPVASDPLVTHLRADGLSYRPKRPVDWLVCDIVERPARIAELVAGWIADGAARYAIFNLKLPMKKRDEEVHRCATIIAERLDRAGVACDFALRQLYHDREEVTGCLVRQDRDERRPAAAGVTRRPRGAGRASRRPAASRP